MGDGLLAIQARSPLLLVSLFPPVKVDRGTLNSQQASLTLTYFAYSRTVSLSLRFNASRADAYRPPGSSVDPTTKCLGGYEVSHNRRIS